MGATLGSGQTESYTSAYIAEAKASTPSAPPASQPASSQRPPVTALDEDVEMTTSQTTIPSDRAVEAAKLKRAQALRGSAVDKGQDDFISLGGASGGVSSALDDGGGDGETARDSSRLVREAASDSDEYEPFVADEQRLGMSRKARRRNAEEERKKISLALEQVHLGPGTGGNDTEDQDAQDEMAWEADQLAKFQDSAPVHTKKARAGNQPSKEEYIPASVPDERPLPLFAASYAALQSKLAEAQTRLDQRKQLIRDAEQTAQTLRTEQEDNRAALDAAVTKRGWFTELNAFVSDLDSFLTAKFPVLLGLERDLVAVARKETARSIRPYIALLNQMVSPGSRSAWPSASFESAGPALGAGHGRGDLAPDTGSQRQALQARWAELWSDVSAPEFRSPTAALPSPDTVQPRDASDSGPAAPSEPQSTALGSDSGSSSSPGSSSLFGRFASWRARYPDEYSAAWGGLSLAQAWSFWARSTTLQVLMADPGEGGFLPDPKKLMAQTSWLAEARAYADGTWPPTTESRGVRTGETAVLGGDEELVLVLLRESILVPLANMVSGHVPDENELAPSGSVPGSWNPWDKEANRRLGELLGEVFRAGAQWTDVQALALLALDHVRAWVEALVSAMPLPDQKEAFVQQLFVLAQSVWPWLSFLLSAPNGASHSYDARIDQASKEATDAPSSEAKKVVDLLDRLMARVARELAPASRDAVQKRVWSETAAGLLRPHLAQTSEVLFTPYA